MIRNRLWIYVAVSLAVANIKQHGNRIFRERDWS